MADLTAKFQLIDEMSEKMASIAESGQSMLDNIEGAGEQIDASFDGISGTATSTAQSVEGVATSIDSIESASASASASASDLSGSIGEYGQRRRQRHLRLIIGRMRSAIMTRAPWKLSTAWKNSWRWG